MHTYLAICSTHFGNLRNLEIRNLRISKMRTNLEITRPISRLCIHRITVNNILGVAPLELTQCHTCSSPSCISCTQTNTEAFLCHCPTILPYTQHRIITMTACFAVYCTGRRQSERCGTRCTNGTALHNNPGEPRQGQGRCAGGGAKDSLKLSTK